MSDVPLPWLSGVALASFRVGGLMLVAPIWSSRTIPAALRASIVVLLIILLLPAIDASPRPAAVGVGSFVAEALVGLGLGLGAAALFAGVELAGEVLAVETGLSGASVLDPLSGQGTNALGQFLTLIVSLLLLVTGGHLVMLEALAGSFAVVPLGGAMELSGGAMELVRMGGLVFAGGLQFAAPVIVAVSVGYVALGVLARTSPQLNMLAVAFPLQIGLGLLVLAGVLPYALTFFGSWPAHVETLAERFLSGLVRP